MLKIKIKKNDTVLVTAGNSKGIKGKVIKIFPKENRAMVVATAFTIVIGALWAMMFGVLGYTAVRG